MHENDVWNIWMKRNQKPKIRIKLKNGLVYFKTDCIHYKLLFQYQKEIILRDMCCYYRETNFEKVAEAFEIVNPIVTVNEIDEDIVKYVLHPYFQVDVQKKIYELIYEK